MNVQTPPKFRYDPYDKDVLLNPVPFYETLRAQHPAYYVEKYDMFVFTRYQDIVDVLSLSDDNVFVGSESTLPMPEQISHRNTGAPALMATNPMGPGSMLASPQYEEMRLAHIKPLRPKGAAELQAFTREVILDRLKTFLPRGKFDLMADYGGMVSAAVTCRLFGIPVSDAPGVLELVTDLASYDPVTQRVNTFSGHDKLRRFIVPAIERRRAAGADGSVGLIDGLINHRTQEDGRALTNEEISDQLVCAFIANTETPPKPAAQGILSLWRNPDQLAEVRKDLDKNVPIAVEEMLRICTTAQWVVRTAHKDVIVAGQHIKPGQRVLLSMFSAARDEREFEDANRFIWNRPIPRSLAFGFGQHHCIGNHVARMQIRMLVREFLVHVSDFEIDLDAAEHSASYFHWGYIKVPVIIKKYAI